MNEPKTFFIYLHHFCAHPLVLLSIGFAFYVYDKIKDMGIDLDDAKGIWAKICDFFVMIGKAIADFFSNLF